MGEMLYPIGIQEFDKLRTGGYVYVDKTMYIHELVRTGSYYFLGRPRRFGKSLLISTMEAYFSGKKELFEGLAIERLTKEWTVYPVLHLDLNGGKYDNETALDEILNKMLNSWEKVYGKSDDETTISMRFYGIIHFGVRHIAVRRRCGVGRCQRLHAETSRILQQCELQDCWRHGEIFPKCFVYHLQDNGILYRGGTQY